MSALYRAIRPLLFALPAETAHELAIDILRMFGRLPGRTNPASGIAVEALGHRFANPLGLAAGLDKDAQAVLGFARLGFGFIEVGTVTPRPQPGNPRPRLFRLPDDDALINRMGFNNRGVDAMVERLRRLRSSGRLGDVRLGVNIGKNKDTALEAAVDDYLAGFAAVAPLADYVTVNLSSPNTPGLRSLQEPRALVAMFEPLKQAQMRLQRHSQRYVPLVLKMAPDLPADNIRDLAGVVKDLELDAVIATNTTLDRAHLVSPRYLTGESGGLSGAPLHDKAVSAVAQLRKHLGPDITIIGVGGIMDLSGAQAFLDAGANLVQIYSGLILRGPALVGEIVRGLTKLYFSNN